MGRPSAAAGQRCRRRRAGPGAAAGRRRRPMWRRASQLGAADDIGGGQIHQAKKNETGTAKRRANDRPGPAAGPFPPPEADKPHGRGAARRSLELPVRPDPPCRWTSVSRSPVVCTVTTCTRRSWRRPVEGQVETLLTLSVVGDQPELLEGVGLGLLVIDDRRRDRGAHGRTDARPPRPRPASRHSLHVRLLGQEGSLLRMAAPCRSA